MSIILPIVPGERAYPTIAPFTIPDGVTYIKTLERLVQGMRLLIDNINSSNSELYELVIDVLNDKIGEINDALDTQETSVDQKIEALEAFTDNLDIELRSYVDNAVDQIINSGIEAQDPVVAGILSDSGSDSYAALGINFVERGDVFNLKLDSIHAALSTSKNVPTKIVFLGSSTTSIDDSYVRRVCKAIGRSYPSDTGLTHGEYNKLLSYPTEASYPTEDNPTNGLTFLNGGVGGTNSGDYVSAAALDKIAEVNPKIVFHMVGSNDFGLQMSLAEYKSNIQNTVDLINAATDNVYHVLLHAHERGGPVRAIKWASYGLALKEIAENTDNAIFIDLSHVFSNVKATTTDPYDVLSTDNVHLTDAGNELMAAALYESLELKQFRKVELKTIVESVKTSDNKSGTNTLLGDTTEPVYGGESKTYIGFGNGFKRSLSKIVSDGASVSFAGFTEISGFKSLSVFIEKLPTDGTVYLDIDRGVTGSATSSAVRLEMLKDRLNVVTRSATSELTVLGTYRGDDISGAMWSIRRTTGGKVQVLRNDVSVLIATIPENIPPTFNAGIAKGYTAKGFILSRLVLKAAIVG